MIEAARKSEPIDPLPQNEISTVKANLKASWEDGDYASFARYMEPGAIRILESWNIGPGLRLLDVGCGAGQTAIPAARSGNHVTGVDLAANLVAYARKRAGNEGLAIRFDEGDAEDLPYTDAGFDVAISMIGAMFAPRPERVASELSRVIRPGGKLYMANWTPRSMPARMFRCVAGFVAPPPGFIAPVLWGDEDTTRQRLDDGFRDIQLRRRTYPQWRYRYNPSELVEFFRIHFGPVKRAFGVLDDGSQRVLRQELEQIFLESSEQSGGMLTVTRGEFLEVIAARR